MASKKGKAAAKGGKAAGKVTAGRVARLGKKVGKGNAASAAASNAGGADPG